MAKIVVFDSGIGGLTVLKELIATLPNEEYLYIADQKNLPYGNKSEEELRTIVWDVIHQYVPKDTDVLVLACNTATAVMHKILTNHLSYPVVGTAKAGGEESVQRVEEGEIGIIATKQTIDNNLYHRHIEKNAKIYQKRVKAKGISCPELANMIEWIPGNEQEREKKKENIKQLIDMYLSPHVTNLKGLIYGCTHYPLIEPYIIELIEEKGWSQLKTIPLINPAHLMAKEVQQLIQYQLKNKSNGKIKLIVTGKKDLFIQKTKEWFQDDFVELLKEEI